MAQLLLTSALCVAALLLSGQAQALDPQLLVVAHSGTGRTAVVASEIAAMFDAKLIVYGDWLQPGASQRPKLAQIRGKLNLKGVKRLYFGSPTWTAAPSPEAQSLLQSLDLHGVEVVPFLTYLHNLAPAALNHLAQTVTARGGKPLAPIILHAAFSDPPEVLQRATQQAVLARPDLWPPPTPTPLDCSVRDRLGGVMCRVPAGPVWLGDDGSAQAPPGSQPPRLQRVAAFAIDRAEVTLAAYQHCQDAGACTKVALQDSQCARLVAAGADRPLPCVAAREAAQYCQSVGKRLPTEAEWTRAARAHLATPFVWGKDLPGRAGPPRGNFGEKRATALPTYGTVADDADWPTDGAAGLAVGCSYAAGTSVFGVCDLAGNLAEWVTAPDGPVLKGGSWLDWQASALRVASRGRIALGANVDNFGFYLTGFRCVAAP